MKKFVTCWKFRHFLPTKFLPIRYLLSTAQFRDIGKCFLNFRISGHFPKKTSSQMFYWVLNLTLRFSICKYKTKLVLSWNLDQKIRRRGIKQFNCINFFLIFKKQNTGHSNFAKKEISFVRKTADFNKYLG